jgi:hypothetical protein
MSVVTAATGPPFTQWYQAQSSRAHMWSKTDSKQHPFTRVTNLSLLLSPSFFFFWNKMYLQPRYSH